MKIGLVVSTADALPSAYVVFRDDLGNCIDRCAALGYDGVEFALRSRSQVDVRKVGQRLAATKLEDCHASRRARSLLQTGCTSRIPT